MSRPAISFLLHLLTGGLFLLSLPAQAASASETLALSPLAIMDDCEFIRSALRQLPLTGGVVHVPAGLYSCAAPIVLDRDHTALIGDGAVFFRLADAANSPLLIIGDIQTPPVPHVDIEIANLNLDGNREHQSIECWGGACDSGSLSVIRNNGVTVRAMTEARMRNIRIRGARSGGIVTEKGCHRLHVDGLASMDNFFDGFAGYETDTSEFSQLELSLNRAAGISIDLGFNRNTFRQTRIEKNHDVGIFMRDSNQNLFDHVTIRESGNHGIFLAQADDVSTCANDNEFQNLWVSQSIGFGFRLNNACTGNELSGVAHFEKNRDGCTSAGTAVELNVKGQLECLP
jgi:hypothetical protein